MLTNIHPDGRFYTVAEYWCNGAVFVANRDDDRTSSEIINDAKKAGADYTWLAECDADGLIVDRIQTGLTKAYGEALRKARIRHWLDRGVKVMNRAHNPAYSKAA